MDWEADRRPIWLRSDDGSLEQAKLDEWEGKKDACELNRKRKEKRVHLQNYGGSDGPGWTPTSVLGDGRPTYLLD